MIGALGQIGTELVEQLRAERGQDHIIAADIREPEGDYPEGPFELLDTLDKSRLNEVVSRYQVKEIYQMAALLSATAEKNPDFAWKLNMEGLLNVLDMAKDKVIDKVFWPSSIAVFGPSTPRTNTPQTTIMDPGTVYGISKLAGERWCEYYHAKYGVDVRSIRYPGLISYKSPPGGGTTDYAIDIFHKALEEGEYTCFLAEDTTLPMMYMPDAIKATIGIMNAPIGQIKIRSSYNISGTSFSPAQIAEKIAENVPGFTISYKPDFRQEIASGWPASIDDSTAQRDWGWNKEFDLDQMCTDMLDNLKKSKNKQPSL